MGGVPLCFVLVNAKSVLWGRTDGPAATPRATLDGLRPSTRTDRSRGAPFGSTTVTPAGDDDLVRDLERLSALHRDGALSDHEFARAKAARFSREAP